MPNFNYETIKVNAGFEQVIGCDEVGRGCLAGPVIAAAVILDPIAAISGSDWYAELNDSKKLATGKRFMLAEQIRNNAKGWGVGLVSPGVIDKINIHNASLLAMQRAIEELQKKISHGTSKSKKTFVFVDGKFTVPNVMHEQEAVVHGDATVMSISAASIVAKVYRDALMIKLHEKLPQYGFANHKGYATEEHRRAIAEHGLVAEHRKSFCKKYM